MEFNIKSIDEERNQMVIDWGWTYLRGAVMQFGSRYAIARERTIQVTTNINTNISSSGSISLDQFYGGTNS